MVHLLWWAHINSTPRRDAWPIDRPERISQYFERDQEERLPASCFFSRAASAARDSYPPMTQHCVVFVVDKHKF